MNIGVHGKSHCAWGSLDRHKLSEDIMVGKETLERFTGNSLTTAACPFGSYNRFVLGFLQKHGFTNVYTSDAAVTSSSSWLRARFSVHDTDTIDSIVSQVATARSFPRSLKDRARIMVKSFR